MKALNSKKRIVLLYAMVAVVIIASLVVILNNSKTLGVNLSDFSRYEVSHFNGQSPESRIEISSADDLVLLSQYLSERGPSESVYILIYDCINMSGVPFTPINTPARIDVDGNEKVIDNIVSSSNSAFVDSCKSGSVFANLGLADSIVINYSSSDNAGYGIFAAKLDNATVTHCFVKGKLNVFENSGNNTTNIGGFVGSVTGTTSITGCFSLCDIITDGSRAGGFAGYYDTTENSITRCYSTGTLTAQSKDMIGGLIGYSESSIQVVTDCYTTTEITVPYTGTVKSVGCNDKLNGIPFDAQISPQRQGYELDNAKTTDEMMAGSSLTAESWSVGNTNYPQLKWIIDSSWSRAKEISSLSTAVIKNTEYYYAKLGSEAELVPENNYFYWSVSGGIEEYYFDGINTSVAAAPITGALSGNIYNENTGRYLFTATGDVKFTANASIYSRDITVHCYETNPYFASGDGTDASDCLHIQNQDQLDAARIFANKGYYYYIIDNNIAFNGNWEPIQIFRGDFNGQLKTLSNLSVNRSGEQNNGLFGIVTSKDSPTNINNVFIKEATIIGGDDSGLLAGRIISSSDSDYSINIANCFVSGTVTSNGENAGGLAGLCQTESINNSIIIAESASSGKFTAVNSVGGIIGSGVERIEIFNSYSSASLSITSNDEIKLGGIAGYMNSSVEGNASIENSLYTGTFVKTTASPICGTGNALLINSYCDRQTTAVSGDITSAKMTSQINAELLNATVWYNNSTDFSNTDYYPLYERFVSAENGNSELIQASKAAAAKYNYNYYYTSAYSASSIDFTSITLPTSLSVSDSTNYSLNNQLLTPLSSAEKRELALTDSAGNNRYLYLTSTINDISYKFVFNGVSYFTPPVNLPISVTLVNGAIINGRANTASVSDFVSLGASIIGNNTDITGVSVTAPEGYTAIASASGHEITITISQDSRWGLDRIYTNLWN